MKNPRLTAAALLLAVLAAGALFAWWVAARLTQGTADTPA
jgi:hypothetical protein